MTDSTLKIKSIRERLASFDRALTAEELAHLFGTHVDTIYKLARRGDIPSFRIGTSVRLDPKKIAEWYERQSIG